MGASQTTTQALLRSGFRMGALGLLWKKDTFFRRISWQGPKDK